MGKASHTGGNVDIVLKNITIYATSGSMNTITTNVGLKMTVASYHLSGHIGSNHNNFIKSLCKRDQYFFIIHYSVLDNENVEANFNLWFGFWIVVDSHSDNVDSLIQCQTLSVLGKKRYMPLKYSTGLFF